jgi:hypothetical protein
MQLLSVFIAAVLLAQTAAAKTTTVTFDATKMKVTGTVTGSCWTGSIASLRSDAYRCMTGNSIHDPCFTLGADTKSVVCPTNLVANSGIRISLRKPLPRANPSAPPNAFMMALAGGGRCNVGTGTVMPGYPFYCSGGLVCAAPHASSKNASAIFVQCGKPRTGTSVTAAGRYLVTMMYQ